MRVSRPAFDADSRAVSETLGYILVFSLIVTTIATATVFGFSGLEDRQAAEQVTNVERAFDVLADNFADISRYEDSSRATEMRLADGTISMGEPVTITIGQWEAGSEQFVDGNTQNVTFRPLVFQSDGDNVVYESGVVFRESRSRSIARSPLPFVVSTETAIVPVTATASSTTTTGVGGDQTVQVVGERRATTRPLENRTINADGETLAVRVDSPRADGWERQFREEGYPILNDSDDTVTAELSVTNDGRVRLPVTNINIRFD